MKINNQRGFTFPELLVVVFIIMILMMYAFPSFRSFNAKSQLKNISIIVKNEIRDSQNKSQNGKVPSSGDTGYWIFHIHTLQTGWADHYEVAGCNPTGFVFATTECFNPDTANYKEITMPARFSIYPVAVSPEPANKYDDVDEVNLFFSSISGSLKVYSEDGTYLGNSVSIKIESQEYPSVYYLFTINSNGTISEQTI
jgi:prepilin-type N-terminal cleavage/methylation domain-containing protein